MRGRPGVPDRGRRTAEAPPVRANARGPQIGRHWPALLLALLGAPLILYGLDRYSLVNGDEEIYHVVARGMVETGDWLTLLFYDQHRVYDTFMNAPLQYWARAVLITFFGDNMWTVRILSALCAIASVLLTYRVGLELTANRATAFLASLFQLTTLQFVYLHCARTGELEPMIVLLYTAAALLFLRASLHGGSFVPHHLCLVLLMNVKSPTVLIPLLAEGLCFALLPSTRHALRRFLASALLILPFGLIWHVSQMIALWQPFLDVVSDMAREATAHDRARPLMSRLSNVGFYVSTIAFGAFPYSLVYPLAIYDVLYGTTGRRDDADSAALARERLGWCVMALFLLAVLLFYLAVSKHHRWYVMPAYPLLSLFLARFVVGLGSRRPSLPLLASIALVVGLLALTMVNLGYNPFNLKSWSIPMTLYWRRPPGVPPLLALPLLSGLLLALLLWLRQRRGERLPGLLAVAFATLLPLYGALRVAEPLRHLDHQSEMAALRSELDALERSGVVLDYPIEPAVPIGWDARYYLGDRYRIEVRADRTFLLHPGRSDAAPPESTRGD